MLLRTSLVILLLSPLGCRNKPGETTDTGAIGTVDTQDTAIDQDQDGYPAGADCDDDNGEVNPGQTEVPYDGLDNDCDDLTLDDDLDSDGHDIDDDCDDTDPTVHPDAVEICNDVDDDCNDAIDDATGDAWYADHDGDGHGDPDDSTLSCDGATGYVADAMDCNDDDGAIHPSADEVCDGLDNDCDLLVDDDDPSVTDAATWYGDLDGDGWGDPANATQACEGPSLFVAAADDCDDSDNAIHPDATEICNGYDDDCDGLVDDDDDTVEGLEVFYVDDDGDGYGTADTSTLACEAPSGFAENPDDCDDDNAGAWPGANEACNGTDDDCDGGVDEAGASDEGLWYLDDDGDGYGDATISIASCDGGTDYVADDTDCDDTDPALNPGAAELCDGADNDCDSLVDDDDPDVSDPGTWYDDDDGDGYGDGAAMTVSCEAPTATVTDDSDCDDGDGAVHPGASEVCNGTDDDCDSLVDDDDPGLADATTWYRDADSDGYGTPATAVSACSAPSGYVADDQDCDDGSADANPLGTEVCDSLDNDCNGAVDDNASDAASWFTDGDGDGYGDSSMSTLACSAPSNAVADATDCDDGDAAVHPGATEVCNDIDDDCDAAIDDDDSGLDASTASTWHADSDGDGFGDASSTSVACDAPSATVADATDCDDATGAVNPDAAEVCNGIDDDCDTAVDDDDGSLDASTTSAWYADSDGDGYGDAGTAAAACSAPSGTVSDGTDCDDGTSAVNPGATEVCNGVDDDCDSDVDDADDDVDTSTQTTWYADKDGDGYGTTDASVLACDQPTSTATNTTDCDDSASGTNPGAAEVCVNGTDENCDGQYSEGCAQQYVSCGGPEAMDPGDSETCSLGTTAVVEGVYISVGCNDGETGVYTLTLEDGGSETVNGSCGSSTIFTDHLSNNVTLTMDSGGGGDNHISMTCCGSGGWGLYYR